MLLWAIWPSKSYAECQELSRLTTLKERCVHLCADLYKKIKDDCTNSLHCLLPSAKVHVYNLRDTKKRTVCTYTKHADGSFINYAIQTLE